MATQQRNQLISEMIAWLESTLRQEVKPEHLSFFIDFENALQQQLNKDKIPDAWFQSLLTTYGTFPFYDRFIRKYL